jgi:hypothetical protein
MDVPCLDDAGKHLGMAPLAKSFGKEGVVNADDLLEVATVIRVTYQWLDHHSLDDTYSHHICLLE